MNTDQLANIEARAQAATEGPWEVDRNYPFTSDLVGIFAQDLKKYVLQVENQDDVDDPTSTADAEFIAHARTDVPVLLALVREQALQLEGLRTDMQDAMADAWDEGHKHYGRYFTPNFPEFGMNPYRAVTVRGGE